MARFQYESAQLAGAVECTNSVSDMTSNHLIVKSPVMLELWGMQNTPVMPSLPSPLWPAVVAPD